MARITKEIRIDVEMCEKCGKELFRYDERGDIPRYLVGVYWDYENYAYCEDTCIPDDE